MKQAMETLRYGCLGLTAVIISAVLVYGWTPNDSQIEKLFTFLCEHYILAVAVLMIGGHKIYTLFQKEDRTESSDMLEYLKSVRPR